MSSEVLEHRLDSICLLVVDCPHATPKWTDSGVVVLRNQNIKGGRLDLSSPSFTDEEHYLGRVKRAVPQVGDIVITREAPMGDVCQIPAGLKCCLGQRQVLLRPDPKEVDSRFLLYALQSPYIQHQIGWNEGTGSTVSNLRIPVLEALSVPTPELAVQREVAETLGAIDDRITLLRETNTTLESIAQALFKSWFVDFDPVHAKMQGRGPEGMDEATAALFPDSFDDSELGPVPNGWRVERLGDVVERVTKGTTPTTLKRPFVEKGINFVKAESMTNDGGFLPEKFAFIDEQTHALLKRSQLQDGDVLISIAGTIGRSAVITEDFLPANTNQAVALIRPKQDVFPSGLLWRFLKQENTMQLMGERVVQAVQANLSLGTLSGLRLVLPPQRLSMKLFEITFSAIDESKALNSQMTLPPKNVLLS
jgi:type I restriction enzyme S subunit